jgi:hypothetical protein
MLVPDNSLIIVAILAHTGILCYCIDLSPCCPCDLLSRSSYTGKQTLVALLFDTCDASFAGSYFFSVEHPSLCLVCCLLLLVIYVMP